MSPLCTSTQSMRNRDSRPMRSMKPHRSRRCTTERPDSDQGPGIVPFDQEDDAARAIDVPPFAVSPDGTGSARFIGRKDGVLGRNREPTGAVDVGELAVSCTRAKFHGPKFTRRPFRGDNEFYRCRSRIPTCGTSDHLLRAMVVEGKVEVPPIGESGPSIDEATPVVVLHDSQPDASKENALHTFGGDSGLVSVGSHVSHFASEKWSENNLTRSIGPSSSTTIATTIAVIGRSIHEFAKPVRSCSDHHPWPLAEAE